MAKKQNYAEKYLSQKRYTVTDIIFSSLLGIGLFLFMLFSRLGYYGFILMLLSAIGLIWTKALRVKDEEYEDILRLIIRDADILPNDENRLALYDIGKGTVAIGKDHKPRSAYWVITDFDFKEDSCLITKHEIDIVNESIDTRCYTAKLPCEVSVEEKEISVPTGKKKIAYITLDGGCISFPTDPTSIDSEAIIKHFR